jgi:hypothetical protein
VRDPAAGQRLAAAAGDGVITPLRLDVTDGGQIAEAAAEVADHVGPAGLAGLVNTPGSAWRLRPSCSRCRRSASWSRST